MLCYVYFRSYTICKVAAANLCLDVQPSYRVVGCDYSIFHTHSVGGRCRTSGRLRKPTPLGNKCHGEAYDDEWDDAAAAAAEPVVAVAQGAEVEGSDIREGLMH